MIILLVGLGSISKRHLKAIYNNINQPKIYALRSGVSTEVVEGVINIDDITKIKEKINFVLICNPSNIHAETIIKVSSLNVPLFVEKPILCDLKFVDEIHSIIKKDKILIYVGCNLRFHPSLLYIKSYLKKTISKINEVNIYCGSYLPNWRPNKDYRKLYSSKNELGGGVHLDLIHEIDYCVWLFGYPISIISTKSKRSNLEIDSFDSANYLFNYNYFTASINLNYYRIDSKREIEILFEDHTIKIDLIKNCVIDLTNNKILFNSNFDIQETYDKQMEFFLNCLKQDRILMNDFNESVEVLKIALHE